MTIQSLGAAPGNSRAREEVLRYRGTELWLTPVAATTAPTNKVFLPGVSGMTRLDAMAAQYDLYRVLACTIEWRTSAAATTSGRIVLAVDYDASDLPTTLTQLAAIQPQVRPVCWEDASLTLDTSKVMRQKWLRCNTSVLYDAVGFVLSFAQYSAGACGEVWCRYDIEFSNPKDPTIAYALLAVTPNTSTSATSYSISQWSSGADRPSFNVNSAVGYAIQVAFSTPGYYVLHLTGVVFNGFGDQGVFQAAVDARLKGLYGQDAYIDCINAVWNTYEGVTWNVTYGINIPSCAAIGLAGSGEAMGNPSQAVLLNTFSGATIVVAGATAGAATLCKSTTSAYCARLGPPVQVPTWRGISSNDDSLASAGQADPRHLITDPTVMDVSCGCGCSRRSKWQHSRTPWALAPKIGQTAALSPRGTSIPPVVSFPGDNVEMTD
jgi:hypothetical protein